MRRRFKSDTPVRFFNEENEKEGQIGGFKVWLKMIIIHFFIITINN